MMGVKEKVRKPSARGLGRCALGATDVARHLVCMKKGEEGTKAAEHGLLHVRVRYLLKA